MMTFKRVATSPARDELLRSLSDAAGSFPGAEQNDYGLVLAEENTPVICGCGGSMFLCHAHAQELVPDGPSTDFEQQVAEALVSLAEKRLILWPDHLDIARRVLRHSAPEVAAAIEAAALVPLTRMTNKSGVPRTALDDSARSAALAALRWMP